MYRLLAWLVRRLETTHVMTSIVVCDCHVLVDGIARSASAHNHANDNLCRTNCATNETTNVMSSLVSYNSMRTRYSD